MCYVCFFVVSGDYLSEERVIEKIGSGSESGSHQYMVESTCSLLIYLSDVLVALKHLDAKCVGRHVHVMKI